MRSREGGLATLTVYVSGSPQPDVYWRKDRRDVDTLTGRFRVIDGGTLQVGTATIGRELDACFLVPCSFRRLLYRHSFPLDDE